jgi:antibiotic biosynthesis monooxygenase (ABM) superfamily enzyme
MNRQYLLFLAALGITHLITTVLFHGALRFTFCLLEVFAIPCVAFGIDRWLDRHRRRKPASACS